MATAGGVGVKVVANGDDALVTEGTELVGVARPVRLEGAWLGHAGAAAASSTAVMSAGAWVNDDTGALPPGLEVRLSGWTWVTRGTFRPAPGCFPGQEAARLAGFGAASAVATTAVAGHPRDGDRARALFAGEACLPSPQCVPCRGQERACE
jgi:hypothetical protein